ncbi:hypothetical protein [Pseudomonas sp. EA_5y_Pfl2_R50]|uniref:hypothetical protein n=1 Tax=Pseudomonas sp. EA_5y_Pfl2_R50 TaxID=3088691 RepID=UPI0030DB08E8
MDYPKSVPGSGLVDGKFVDEDPTAGTPGICSLMAISESGSVGRAIRPPISVVTWQTAFVAVLLPLRPSQFVANARSRFSGAEKSSANRDRVLPG